MIDGSTRRSTAGPSIRGHGQGPIRHERTPKRASGAACRTPPAPTPPRRLRRPTVRLRTPGPVPKLCGVPVTEGTRRRTPLDRDCNVDGNGTAFEERERGRRLAAPSGVTFGTVGRCERWDWTDVCTGRTSL